MLKRKYAAPVSASSIDVIQRSEGKVTLTKEYRVSPDLITLTITTRIVWCKCGPQWQNLDKEFATCAIPLVSTSEFSAVSLLFASRIPVKPSGIKATILPPQPIIRG